MGARAAEVVADLKRTLAGAARVAQRLEAAALPEWHRRLDGLVSALVAAGPDPETAAAVRRDLDAHRALLASLHDTVTRALERGSRVRPTAYGAGGRMQAPTPVPILESLA